MLDETTPAESGTPVDAAAEEAARKAAARKAAAKKAAETRKRKAAEAAAAAAAAGETAAPAAAEKTPAAKAPAKKAAAKKAPAKKAAAADTEGAPAAETAAPEAPAPAKKAATRKAPAKKAPARKAAAPQAEATDESAAAGPSTAVLFQAPDATTAPRRRPAKKAATQPAEAAAAEAVEGAEPDEKSEQAPRQQNRQRQQPKKAVDPVAEGEEPADAEADAAGEDESGEEGTGGPRRRRRRGGRRRRKPSEGGEGAETAEDSGQGSSDQGEDELAEDGEDGEGGTTRRRRVRVREGQAAGAGADDANTQVKVRPAKSAEDQITAISGSTRLEAKKQRRREGREAGRRRAPIASEAEFLARREAVERVMVIRQRKDLTQIGVLEDKVLVEHYVARESQTSLIGNVYLGRVQNVLPSMEAAFIDIGKGRNAVLYAGEVNWSALGHKEGQPRKIESVLSSGQTVLVQVTKDPVGHKGARLTSQVSLAGRFLVYVPDGTTSGISRKLPDTERARLKTLLKEIVPDTAGVIVRTAAEGASEEELTRDVERLKARWEEIERQTKGDAKGNAPKLLYGEPDLTLKVVRDLFTEDFSKLVIQGDEAWETVQQYVAHVAPDLEERLEKFEQRENGGDVFATYRIDEQIAKGLDRKVWLPSGGSLIIDRTEAMTVVDVNTGKFTGSGGNLEETVTKNNLEAAEEIVRQLRLRDIGGIIVVDFIDMVLESNRDLVLRRMVECLGRDRTRHQVAEVTSLGLVQMTRKRIGTGLVEAFSENCEHCQGRGVVIHSEPIEPRGGVSGAEEPRRNRRSRGGRGGQGGEGGQKQDGQKQDGQNGQKQGGQDKQDGGKSASPSPKDVAAKARHEGTDDSVEAVDTTAPEAAVTEAAEAPVTDAAETPAVETPAVETRAAEVPAEQAVVAATEEPAENVAEAVVVAEAEVPLAAAEIEEPEAAPVVEEPVAPAAPKVVTRTRKAVSRPAGATAAQAEPVAIVVPEVTVSDHTPVVEPPKVITRTRKAVTRPAGGGAVMPAEQPAAAVPAEAPEEASAEASGTEETAHAELHVPIKKKGARKR